jgi:hypothetical protein
VKWPFEIDPGGEKVTELATAEGLPRYGTVVAGPAFVGVAGSF